ncbi:hypothetical protein FRB97_004670 [Tulasnella sp. 331]|nr:hypothetical protein FRB97_004670 [Tulasnella sp. 331]KAG8881307.1 hypothetical protein FRB98_004419 [Tulasnella sp. 332]
MAASTPPPSKSNRRAGDAKRRIVGHVNYAAAPQLHQELSVKPATRSKAGCMTCRIRRKKCDLEKDGDSCKTCLRLHIECLGWGAKRPDALRDPNVVKECQNMIKVFLASNNMIKGSARSAVPQPGQPPSPSLHLTDLLKRSSPSSYPRATTTRAPTHFCTLPPLLPRATADISNSRPLLPSISSYVAQATSPSSSSSANAGGGGAGDGQPSYIGASFLTFDNLKRDEYGTFEMHDYPPAPTKKGRGAPRKPKGRQTAATQAPPPVEDEDADGSVEDFDEPMEYEERESSSSFSRHPQQPPPSYPPPPPISYDSQYRGRYSMYQGPLPHQSQYAHPPSHPYAQSALRTGSHEHDRKPSHDDTFRELERERERDMDSHYRRSSLQGPPPAPPPHGMSYPYSQTHDGPPYRLPHSLTYGAGVGVAKDYSYGGYRNTPSQSEMYSNVLPPLQGIVEDPYAPPHRFPGLIPPPKPMAHSLSVSPTMPMTRAPSYQTNRSESYSATGSPDQTTLRNGSSHPSPAARYSANGRTMSGGQYNGDVEMMEGDVDGEPMSQQQNPSSLRPAQATQTNTFLPSGSSFGDMYQFDRYTDAELGVAPTSTALVPTMTDLTGTLDHTQFVAAMTAIGMNGAAGLTDEINLAPAGVAALEQFHQTLSGPAQAVDPMPFFDTSIHDKQLQKQLELLYMYRGKLCNLQYHIAHSTDASIADDLFNIAMTSTSALYGTLTLTSLFKIMTRDVNNGPLDEALLELQFFKDKVAKGLGDKMRDPSSVDSGDAMAGLHMVSAILFEGGTNAQWEKFLDVAKTWVQKHPIVKTGSWSEQRMLPSTNGAVTLGPLESPESLAMAAKATVSSALIDKKNAFIIKATAWFDVIGSVTMRRKPHFLSTYQELFGRQGGAMMERIMGCDERVLLAIAETAALAEWRHDMERKNCLSFMDLAARANKIEPHLSFTGPVYSGASFVDESDGSASPNSTVDEYDAILGTTSGQASASTSTSGGTSRSQRHAERRTVHQIRLVSNVFRAAGKLYLHTVVSGCNPDVKEIKDAVAETVSAFEHLQASTTDRSLVFPIALAGCMTDNPDYRLYLVSRLKALGKEGEAVGNTKSCLQLMEAVWKKRDEGSSRNVDWIDTMREKGWSLLLA